MGTNKFHHYMLEKKIKIKQMKELSLVVCVYNEEENIAPLGKQIIEALEGYNYEVIFVNDGSTDKTRSEILKIKHGNFVLLDLKMNYGQSTALQAGIDLAEGEYIVLLDGDLQNDPADSTNDAGHG